MTAGTSFTRWAAARAFAGALLLAAAHGTTWETSLQDELAPYGDSIRLVASDSSRPHSGLVELKHNGEWRGVCGRLFDAADADVVCRQLGFEGYMRFSPFVSGGPSYWLQNVECKGDEARIEDCGHSQWGDTSCSSYDAVSVTCTPPYRLVGGDTHSGDVAVYHDGSWRAVCDSGWDDLDAQSFCLEIGFSPEGATATVNSAYGTDTSYWLSDLSCGGTETFAGCVTADSWGSDAALTCARSQAAGAKCSPSVRFRDSTAVSNGIVEVYTASQARWNPVRAAGWTARDGKNAAAQVLCRGMGLPTVGAQVYPTRVDSYLQTDTRIEALFDCSGGEATFTQCPNFYMYFSQNLDVLSVFCPVARMSGPTDGIGSVQFWNSTWRDVCTDSWTEADARVACRHFYGAYLPPAGDVVPHNGSYFDDRRGPDPNRAAYEATGGVAGSPLCNGTESRLRDCAGSIYSVDSCSSQRRGVVCPAPVRHSTDGDLELFVDGEWALPTADIFSVAAAQVVCRALGLPFSQARYSNNRDVSAAQFVELNPCEGGEEYPQLCGARRYTSSFERKTVSVECPTVALVEGTDSFNGIINLYSDYQFRPVCASSWTEENSQVVCKAAGSPPGLADGVKWEVTDSTDTNAWLSTWTCSGSEDKLSSCSSGSSLSACDPSQVVRVQCPSNVRLLGAFPWSGYPQVYTPSTGWGYLCDQGWDTKDSLVVARSLRLSTDGVTRRSGNPFNPSPYSIARDGLNCGGGETSVLDCPWQNYISCNEHDSWRLVRIEAAPALRFRGDAITTSGALESSNEGSWRFVCSDGFGTREAAVACRELGFSAFAATVADPYAGEEVREWWLTQLACRGNEQRLLECERPAMGQGTCPSGKAASVTCGPYSLAGWSDAPNAGMVRIPPENTGDTYTMRRAIVEYRSYNRPMENSKVACRSSGLPSGRASYFFIESHESCDSFVASCTGDEATLGDCSGYRRTYCTHSNALGVRCPTVDLVGSSKTDRGDVLTYFLGEWRGVCASQWTMTEANVVCHELGFVGAKAAYNDTQFGTSTTQFWLSDVKCTGEESSLADCPSAGVGTVQSSCTAGTVAGVQCSRSRLALVDKDTLKPTDGFEGVLAMFSGGNYHVLEDHALPSTSLTLAAACSEMGFEGAVGVRSTDNSQYSCYWARSEQMDCAEGDFSLSDCANLLPYMRCTYRPAVRLRCPTVKVHGPSASEGDVTIHRSGEWRAVCDEGWDDQDAAVVCSELGFGPAGAVATTASTFGAHALTGYGVTNVACDPGTTSMANCSLTEVSSSYSCGGSLSNLAGVRCSSQKMRLTSPEGRTNEGFIQFLDTNTGIWRYVWHSNKQWTSEYGPMLCRSLGLPSRAARLYVPDYALSGPLDMVNVAPNCDPLEKTDLWSCITSDLFISLAHLSSGSSAPAQYLECGATTVAPALPHFPILGVPQLVQPSGVWRPACSSGFGPAELDNVCRAAGWTGAGATHRRNVSTALTGYAPPVSCPANSTLEECTMQGECTAASAPEVRCRPSVFIEEGTGLAKMRVGKVDAYIYSGNNGFPSNQHSYGAEALCRAAGLPDAFASIAITPITSSDCHEGRVELPWYSWDYPDGCANASSPWDCRLHAVEGYSRSSVCNYPAGSKIRLSCPAVRLVGGASGLEGDVSVSVDGEWRMVCDDGWGSAEAAAVCRSLGLNVSDHTLATTGGFYSQISRLPGSSARYWWSSVSCSSNASSIFNCKTVVGQGSCGAGRAAGVRCDPPVRFVPGTIALQDKVVSGQLMMQEGADPVPGRVAGYQYIGTISNYMSGLLPTLAAYMGGVGATWYSPNVDLPCGEYKQFYRLTCQHRDKNAPVGWNCHSPEPASPSCSLHEMRLVVGFPEGMYLSLSRQTTEVMGAGGRIKSVASSSVSCTSTIAAVITAAGALYSDRVEVNCPSTCTASGEMDVRGTGIYTSSSLACYSMKHALGETVTAWLIPHAEQYLTSEASTRYDITSRTTVLEGEYGFGFSSVPVDFGGLRLAGGQQHENMTSYFAGSTFGSGRTGAVQVMTEAGEWRYVCGDGFGADEAATVCRQLGTAEELVGGASVMTPSPVRAAVAEQTGYHITNVDCSGVKHGSIRTCTFVDAISSGGCSSGPVAVSCPGEGINDAGVSLSKGHTGAIKVGKDIVSFDRVQYSSPVVAPVMCARLGFPTVGAFMWGHRYRPAEGAGSYTQYSARMPSFGNCNPGRSLRICSQQDYTTVYDFGDVRIPHERAFAFCPMARLVSDSVQGLAAPAGSAHRGVAQFFESGQWMSVCGDASSGVAAVACGLAGFPRAGASLVDGASPALESSGEGLSGLTCSGEEMSLDECSDGPVHSVCSTFAVVECSAAVRLQATHKTPSGSELVRSASGPLQVHYPGVGWLLPSSNGLQGMNWATRALAAKAVCEAAGFEVEDASFYSLHPQYFVDNSINRTIAHETTLAYTPGLALRTKAIMVAAETKVQEFEHTSVMAVTCAVASLAGSSDATKGLVEYSRGGETHPVCPPADATPLVSKACRAASRPPQGSSEDTASSFVQPWPLQYDTYWSLSGGSCAAGARDLGACGTWSKVVSCAEDPLAANCGPQSAPSKRVRLVDEAGMPTLAGAGFVQFKVAGRWFLLAGGQYSDSLSSSLMSAMCRSMALPSSAASVNLVQADSSVDTGLLLQSPGSLTCEDDEEAVACVERLRSDFIAWAQQPGQYPQLQKLQCPRVRVGGPRSGYEGGRMQGDVEVYHNNMWRPVCADGFGLEEAQVACRSVGEEAAEAEATDGSEFGLSASTGYALQSVTCTGSEIDLLECSNSGFDFTPSSACPAGNSAGVRCGYRTRLTAAHYVQTTSDGTNWRYIRAFTTAERFLPSAQVLCRSMGRPHVGAYYAVRNASLPRCEFLQNFECQGTEDLPSRCNYQLRDVDCGRNYDANLLQMACSSTRIQGERPYEGPLEVFHTAQAVWQKGCLDWMGSDSAATARVICRSLGFDESVRAALVADSSGSTSGVTWPFRATCTGHETDLSKCALSAVGESDTCSARAAVECAPMLRQVENVGDTASTTNGRGFVQVYALGKWVTPNEHQVHGSGPSVFCRALGFPGEDAITTVDNSMDYKEYSLYFDGSFSCSGTEQQPYLCGGIQVSNMYTNQFRAVRLLCQTTRLMIGSTLRSRWRGDVEQYHDGVWKPVCDTGWDKTDATVVCRGMGVDLMAGGVTALRGSIYAGAQDGGYGAADVACTGSESALDECSQSADVSECPAERAAGVECPANVRFLAKDSLTSGSVEVFLSGQWRPYRVRPNEKPGQQTAQLLCSTLGLAHDSASASLDDRKITGSHNVEVVQLYCSGSEDTIASCGHWTNYVSEARQVNVSCPEVRLVDSSDPTAGVVEQYFLGEWRSVCGRGWGEPEAEVACNALGMSVAAGAKPSTALATAGTTYWLSGVDCVGAERQLGECIHTGLGDGDATCSDRTRASLRCTVTPQEPAEEIRLAYTDSDGDEHTGPAVRKGMVQVRYPNSNNEPEWRYVCNNAFDPQDASVVCRQLGYSLSSPDDAKYFSFTTSVRQEVLNSASSSNVRIQGYSPPGDLYWLQSTYCSGDEERLQDCPRGSSVGTSYCGDWQVAVVECLGTSTVAVVDSGADVNYTLSLEKGGNASFAEGLVKIAIGDESRYVCDDAWDVDAASVVCGELGFTRRSALATIGSTDAPNGRVNPVYFMDNVECDGDEKELDECTFPGWGLHNCGAEEAAGVNCWLGRERFVNCSTEAPPIVQHLNGVADNCTANCSTPVEGTQAECECECLQRKFWRSRFLPLSLHRRCKDVHAFENATETEVAAAVDGAACPLATVPSGNFSSNASLGSVVREEEAASLREVEALWQDWNNTRVEQELCDAVRRGFAGQKAIQLRLEARGERPTPLLEAAMALVRELNEEKACGKLLYCSPGNYPPRANEVPEGEEATCQVCPQGTYQPTFGAVSRDSCTACPAGYASAVDGAVTADTCKLCAAGSFAESGASSCTKCPQGTYNEVAGAVAATSCRFCPAGTYGHRIHRSPFNESCVTCPAGKYQPAPGKLECVSCPRGSYGEEAGAVEKTACKLCPAGSYSSVLGLAGRDQCVKCAKGKFSSVAGQSENKCVPCSSSTVAEAEGEAECVPCVPPKYRVSSEKCEWCESNKVIFPGEDTARVQDPLSCERTCAAGEAPTEDNSYCVKCDRGFYQPSGAQSQCEACPLGTEAQRQGMTRCVKCETGSFANASALEKCLQCPGKRITLSESSASHTDCVCPKGQYSLDVAAYAAACRSCPSGGTCVKGLPPSAQRGYWYSLRQPDLFYPCTPLDSCVGGDLADPVATAEETTSTSRRRLLASDEEASRTTRLSLECVNAIAEGREDSVDNCTVPDASRLCADGYTGERCASCDSDHYRLGSVCKECPPSVVPFLLMFAAAVFALGSVAVLMLRTGVNLAAITIALEFFSFLGKFSSMDLSWSDTSEDSMSGFSIASLDPQFVAPECLNKTLSFEMQWLGMFALPLAFAVVLLTGHSFWLMMCSLCKRGDVRRKVTRQRVGALLLVLQIMYLTLVEKAMQALDCSPLPDGSSSLDSSPSIRCWDSDEHKVLAAFGVIAMILYVFGIPLLFWRVLRYAKHQARSVDRQMLQLEDEAERLEMRRAKMINALVARQSEALQELEDLRAENKEDKAVQEAATADPEANEGVLALKKQLEGTGKRHRALLYELELLDATAGCLYKRFKITNSYWILVQMLRKAAIVTAFVMLTNRPMIQATMVAMVLVVSLFLQLSFLPYMPFQRQSSFAQYYGSVVKQDDAESESEGGESDSELESDDEDAGGRADVLKHEEEDEEEEDEDEDDEDDDEVEAEEGEGASRPASGSSSEQGDEAARSLVRRPQSASSKDERKAEAGAAKGVDDGQAMRPVSGNFASAAAIEASAVRKSQQHIQEHRLSFRERVKAEVQRMAQVASTDPNMMEATSLFSSLIVVICGQLYRASRLEQEEEASAEETSSSSSSDSSSSDSSSSSSNSFASAVSSTSLYSTGMVDVVVLFIVVTSTIYMVLMVLMPLYDAYLVRRKKAEVSAVRKGKDVSHGGRRRRKLRVVVRDMDELVRTSRPVGDTEEIPASTSAPAVVAKMRTQMSQHPELREAYSKRQALSLLAEAVTSVQVPAERANAIAAAAQLLESESLPLSQVEAACSQIAMALVKPPRSAQVSKAASDFFLSLAATRYSQAMGAQPIVLDHLFVALHAFKADVNAARDLSAAIGKLMDRRKVSTGRLGRKECVNHVKLAQGMLRMFAEDEDICGSVIRWTYLVLHVADAEPARKHARKHKLSEDVEKAVERFPRSRQVNHFGKRLLKRINPDSDKKKEKKKKETKKEV